MLDLPDELAGFGTDAPLALGDVIVVLGVPWEVVARYHDRGTGLVTYDAKRVPTPRQDAAGTN
jgi:hypothetical protein